MLRRHGVRLAVPLTLASIVLLLIGLGLVLPRPADAIDGCRPTSHGVDCSFGGSSGGSSSSSGSSASSPRRTPPPPLRYLATSAGRCWYWSRYPPGYDSWNSAYDQSIILTRWRLPRCQGRTPQPRVIRVDAAARAWTVFRSFPLDAPRFHITPVIGITNLPSRLHLPTPPRALTHAETLPDGRRLEVHARVAAVWVDWSDGTPANRTTLGTAAGDPGGVRHAYTHKSCTATYRSSNLHGGKCHHGTDRYPVTVTYEWAAQYRAGGGWIHLGSIDRSRGVRYDVDEVLGVLTGR